ncbi:hypothetical protein WG66_005903 [Moniliophthora roreri]|nr:hypothetical protein WG66_005903 [Moniliophthora roreri]
MLELFVQRIHIEVLIVGAQSNKPPGSKQQEPVRTCGTSTLKTSSDKKPSPQRKKSEGLKAFSSKLLDNDSAPKTSSSAMAKHSVITACSCFPSLISYC